MSIEPTFDDIPEDANQPTTRHDVAVLWREIEAVNRSIGDLRTEMRGQIREMQDEIFRHFDVAVENIEDSLRGANADEISLMQDRLDAHTSRLDLIDERVGLR